MWLDLWGSLLRKQVKLSLISHFTAAQILPHCANEFSLNLTLSQPHLAPPTNLLTFKPLNGSSCDSFQSYIRFRTCLANFEFLGTTKVRSLFDWHTHVDTLSLFATIFFFAILTTGRVFVGSFGTKRRSRSKNWFNDEKNFGVVVEHWVELRLKQLKASFTNGSFQCSLWWFIWSVKRVVDTALQRKLEGNKRINEIDLKFHFICIIMSFTILSLLRSFFQLLAPSITT